MRTFLPMSDEDVRTLLSKTSKAAARGDFELFKTTSIFDGTAQNPEWLGEEPQRLQQYASPNHRDGVVHHTCDDAEADNEHFDGKTTE